MTSDTILPLFRPANSTSPVLPRKTEGTIGSRKIVYPEVGQDAEKVKTYSFFDVLKKVTVAASIVFSGIAIGLLAGGPFGASLGAVVAAGVIGIAAVAKIIYDFVTKNQFLRALPSPTHTSEHKVGKYYHAKTIVTDTADAGFEWKKKLINAARESIELSANFAGGSSFREILSLIDAKMSKNAKVKTHLIISIDLLEAADSEALTKLQQKFPDRFSLLSLDRYYKVGFDLHSEENHMKMLLVDGKYFVAGGTSIHPRFCHENYEPEHDNETPTLAARLLEGASRDSDAVGQSVELCSAMRNQFFKLYRLWEIRSTSNDRVPSRFYPLKGEKCHIAGFSALETVRMKFIVSGPEHRGNNAIVKEYEKRILHAKNEVRLGTNRFCPSKKIRNALLDVKSKNPAFRRIAYVNGMGAGFTVGSARSVQIHAGRAHYHLVDKVYEYAKEHQFYHKKVASFDDTHMIIGSYNLGRKSTRYDHEMIFVIKNKKITNECRETLKEDGRRSTKITAKTSRELTIFERLFSWIIHKTTENFV
jgi:phosphatidylserine/phosphatidylglycerophosphate/cardiolipin synthase-like enzyme